MLNYALEKAREIGIGVICIEETYCTPKGHYIASENPQAFEAFEATFPSKEKKRQEGQIFNKKN